jgi:hypothetical protein
VMGLMAHGSALVVSVSDYGPRIDLIIIDNFHTQMIHHETRQSIFNFSRTAVIYDAMPRGRIKN